MKTWDVTLRIAETYTADVPNCPVSEWGWEDLVQDRFMNIESVKFVGATEVQEWHFGDVVTEDNRPAGEFVVADRDGDSTPYLPERNDGPYRLTWVEGGFSDD